MSKLLYKELSESVLGGGFKVHNHLGPGLLELAYEGAPVIELRNRGLAAARQVVYQLYYCGELAGAYVVDLVDFRRQMKSEYGLPVREELHASELVRVKNLESYRPIRKRDRIAILTRTVCEIPRLFRHGRILNVCLDKTAVDPPENSGYAGLAWNRFIQRYDPYLKAQKDKGIIIADDNDEPMIRSLLRRMRRYNPVRSHYSGTYDCPTDNVLEDPFLRDSKHSYLIQMADLVTFALFQREFPQGKLAEVRDGSAVRCFGTGASEGSDSW